MIRAMLIDDEAIALDVLEIVLMELGGVIVAGTYLTASDALEKSRGDAPDIIFLDIEMPGLHGLPAARKLQDMHPRAEIVFVSAYSHYAFDAFELDALDYLSKPVSPSRLHKTIARYHLRRTAPPPASPRAPCRLTVFGAFQLLDASGDIVPWRTRKAKELFAFLWHHRAQAVQRDVILEQLWPDASPDRTLAHFHTTLYYLRRTLRQLSRQECVTFADERYRLRTGDWESDEERLLALLETPGHTREVIELYRGEYLEAEHYEWAQSRGKDIHNAVLRTLEREAEAAEQPEWKETIRRKLIELEPYREAYHLGAIEHYCTSGMQEAAERQFSEMARVFSRDLGVPVSDEALKLAARYGLSSGTRLE